MSTLATPSILITPDDLLRLPDASSFELVDGKLLERHVSIESSEVAIHLGHLLLNERDRSGGISVFGADLGYQCFPDDPNRVRRPDVSVVLSKRMTGFNRVRGYMPIPPDLAVEVVSPNDVAYELAEKVEEYLAAGFGLIWVAYPNLKTVVVYRAGGGSHTLHENDVITGDPVLPSFRCRVGDFFPPADR